MENTYFGANSSKHYALIALFLEERGIEGDGLIGRTARDNLVNFGSSGRYEEDILLGVALIRAIAQWRALAHLSGFDPHLHAMQMKHEVERVATFLSRHFRARSFLVQRPKKTKQKYVEILSQHSYI